MLTVDSPLTELFDRALIGRRDEMQFKCPGSEFEADLLSDQTMHRQDSVRPEKREAPKEGGQSRTTYRMKLGDSLLEFTRFSVDFDFIANFDESGNLQFVLRVLQDGSLGDLA